MELNLEQLLKRHEEIQKKLNEENLSVEARTLLLGELKTISEIIDNYNKTVVEDRKIDADLLKAEQDAQTKKKAETYGLIGNVVKGVCTLGAAVVGAVASIVSVARILHAEENDTLCISKALQFVFRPRG